MKVKFSIENLCLMSINFNLKKNNSWQKVAWLPEKKLPEIKTTILHNDGPVFHELRISHTNVLSVLN